MYKMIPKGRYGGIMQTPYQRDPLILNKSVPKAQDGTRIAAMEPMTPIKAQLQLPPLNTTVLDPMVPKDVSGGINGGSAIEAGASMVGGVLDAVDSGGGEDKYGLTAPGSTGIAIGKGAAKGAAAGASFGPWGAAIGGVIGGATGLISSNKENKAYDKAFTKATQANTRQEDAKLFQSMMAKDGMKFGNKINKILSTKTPLIPIFKSGGKINVIAGGKLHRENNNLGNGDKGIPVINTQGTKKYELEKEEWVTNNEVTKQLESMAAKYNQSNKASDLEDLGRFVSTQLMSNTQDNSTRYNLKVKS